MPPALVLALVLAAALAATVELLWPAADTSPVAAGLVGLSLVLCTTAGSPGLFAVAAGAGVLFMTARERHLRRRSAECADAPAPAPCRTPRPWRSPGGKGRSGEDAGVDHGHVAELDGDDVPGQCGQVHPDT